jgi:hypothetical protein
MDLLSRTDRSAAVRCALLLLATALAAGCDRPRAAASPGIEFSVVPEAAAGGGARRATISGRVRGARPGQRIVLFSKGGVWWVQPLTVEPFTTIAADATWTSSIHLGTEYAAVLVDPAYSPPATTEFLPRLGDGVVAVATVPGAGVYVSPARKVLTFSGYEWEIRQIPSDRGGDNEYDSANAWTDAQGFLHLRLVQRNGQWTSAEVILTRSLGYGTYTFLLQDTAQLDPAAAIGLLTWDDQGAEQNHRELDIEISRWGDPTIPNAQYVLQPYYVPANVARFSAPAGRLTHAFRWEPGRASFSTLANGVRARNVVARHEFTSGIPTPGAERVHMNLYFFRFSPLPPRAAVEVVIERFQYLP